MDIEILDEYEDEAVKEMNINFDFITKDDLEDTQKIDISAINEELEKTKSIDIGDLDEL